MIDNLYGFQLVLSKMLHWSDIRFQSKRLDFDYLLEVGKFDLEIWFDSIENLENYTLKKKTTQVLVKPELNVQSILFW